MKITILRTGTEEVMTGTAWNLRKKNITFTKDEECEITVTKIDRKFHVGIKKEGEKFSLKSLYLRNLISREDFKSITVLETRAETFTKRRENKMDEEKRDVVIITRIKNGLCELSASLSSTSFHFGFLKSFKENLIPSSILLQLPYTEELEFPLFTEIKGNLLYN